MVDKMLAYVNSLLVWHHYEVDDSLPDMLEVEDRIRSLVQGINYMNSSIRTFVFPSVADEVRYFKEVQPLLVKEYIFFKGLQQFYSNVSPLRLQQPKVFSKEIDRLLQFTDSERTFYDYICQKHTYNDLLYFRRLSETNEHSVYSLTGDPHSSCSHGFLLAKLLAYEKLVRFYTQQLRKLTQPASISVNHTARIKWTAKKVDAVELVYALYFSGAVDTGECTLQDLAKQFGNIFQVQIADQLYREFIDIKRRKIETARFLVKLTDQFRERVEDDYL